MEFQKMSSDQHERLLIHLRRIRRKYAIGDDAGKVYNVMRNIMRLCYYTNYPVSNIEYFPVPNVAVMTLLSDDERRSSLTVYVRSKEFEVRYGRSSFAKFDTAKYAAEWLQNF